MVAHEDIEAVIIAVPLWAHVDVTVGCLEAGKHVLCEKMMAWDVAGCERMRAAAIATNRVLEIGYQRNYNAMYQAAFEGVIKPGVLGDVYLSRIAWHRNGNWRRKGDPPSPDYNPAKWGYPTFEHLLNWRLYKRYSRGLLAELASHQVNIVNWFFGAEPVATMGTGGIYRFNDGQREIGDHVYTTFEYPGGRTAVFSSIESNAWDHYYEAFFGTKGTLILQGEADAFLFDEGTGQPAVTGIEMTPRTGGPAPGGVRKPRRRCRRQAGGRGRRAPPARIGWSLIATRSRRSARPSERAGRWRAGPIARSGRRAPASRRSTPSSRRAACPSTRRTGGAHVALARLLQMTRFSRGQAVSLVLLRTLIGWHFLYEGYYKLALPAWSAAGQPLGAVERGRIFRASTGPLSGAFHSLAASRFVPWVDAIVPVVLVLVGVSLTLGLFTRLGCWVAMALLALFYWPIPTSGAPVTGQEGTYLLVSKNLIELVAVHGRAHVAHQAHRRSGSVVCRAAQPRLDPPRHTTS